MSISSTTRTAGPFVGNDSTTVFPFAFKVFASSELLVVQRDDSTLIETTLVLDTDYSVSLNANQNSNPGGSVTLLGGALATGQELFVTSDMDNLQALDLTNQGGFYPETINDALDKLCIQNQQQQTDIDRSVKISNFDDEGNLDQLVQDVTTLAADIDNLDTLVDNIADINTVAGVSAAITTVSEVSADITTVAGIDSDVTVVAGVSAGVSAVAANEANIDTVADNTTNINTLAGSITNIDTVATDLTGDDNIGTVADWLNAGGSAGVGVGQTWQDVTIFRSTGVVYTNTTGQPIQVNFWSNGYLSSGSYWRAEINVDGIAVARAQAIEYGGSATQTMFATAIVPNGSTYEYDAYSSGTMHMYELR